MNRFYLSLSGFFRFFLMLCLLLGSWRGMAQMLPERASRAIPGQYIVFYKTVSLTNARIMAGQPFRARQQAMRDEATATLRKHRLGQKMVLHVYETALKGFAVSNLTAAEADLLRHDEQVDYIAPDQVVTLDDDPPANPAGQAIGAGQRVTSEAMTVAAQTVPWGITRVGGGASGAGKRAWILDTGIEPTHPDLNVNTALATYFAGTSPNDEVGHGTFIAGVIAAKDNGIGVIGVAAGAEVVSVRVFDKDGGSSDSKILAGINYTAAHAASGDVANLSFGIGIFQPPPGEEAAVLALANVCRVVISAGNDAHDANLNIPARLNAPTIYTVSAIDETDHLASFSNYGVPPVDYAAPGVNLLSCWLNGSYKLGQGTSYAAPHVAGLLLLGNICSSGLAIGVPDGSIAPIAHTPQVIYVTQAGAGSQNGSSWANAYPGTSLQTAINAAQATCIRQVWVAAGTYKPTTTNDRDGTFTMRPGVAIYGGFAGNETALSQRPAISVTVPSGTTLSADIANNTNVSAYNLFRNGNTLTNSAVLDGFVLAFALANNTGTQQGKAVGGALFNEAVGGTCSPTIRNCWFMNNTALSGGGAIWNQAGSGGDASPLIENCRFQNNAVQAGSGGAIYNRAQSGGGTTLNYATRSSPTILNCLFVGNSCSNGNAGYDGGGAIHTYAYGATASPILTGCSFQTNSSTIRGGAICTNGSDNGAGGDIGMARPVLTNCSFQGNSAPQGPVIANIHFNNNGSSTNANATLTNCAIYNGTSPFSNASGASVTLTYSVFDPAVAGIAGVNASGPGNVTTTVSPFASTTSTQLAQGSPAIDAGSPATTTATLGTTLDLAGNLRITGCRVDMGAYESAGVVGVPRATVKAGVWSDPAIWSCGVVPVLTDMVQVNHAVMVSTNYVAQVKQVKYGTGGKLTYQTGAQVKLGF